MQKLLKFNLKLLAKAVLALTLGQVNIAMAAENWHWHGFVAQGLMQAKESNFVNNDGEVSAVSPGRFEADTGASKGSDGHDGQLSESNER